jgi:hypothetical protein
MEKVGTFFGRLEYITATWYILWPFGILVAIWYILPRFGILCQEKIWQPWIVQKLNFDEICRLQMVRIRALEKYTKMQVCKRHLDDCRCMSQAPL